MNIFEEASAFMDEISGFNAELFDLLNPIAKETDWSGEQSCQDISKAFGKIVEPDPINRIQISVDFCLRHSFDMGGEVLTKPSDSYIISVFMFGSRSTICNGVADYVFVEWLKKSVDLEKYPRLRVPEFSHK